MSNRNYKYHYIYKTTCSITDKYYVGMHSTNNLNDTYLGSGRRLWLSINKHGRENHTKEIIEFLDSRQALKLRESELVNEDLLKDPMCMNLKLGGEGGFCSEENKHNFLYAGTIASAKSGKCKETMKRLLSDETWSANYKEKMSRSLKNKQNWLGKNHTTESKKKIGVANATKQKGSYNSQFGTMWITNSFENKKIKKTDDIPSGWVVGRKLKHGNVA